MSKNLPLYYKQRVQVVTAVFINRDTTNFYVILILYAVQVL